MENIRCCTICKQDKPVGEFSRYKYKTRNGNNSFRYESRCRTCNQERKKQHYSNPEKAAMMRVDSLRWKQKNREHIKLYNKKRLKDPTHRVNRAKAQRLRKARMRSGSSNRDPAIAEIYQLAMDTQNKLEACVECDDPLELKMHVDHIEPLCLGGKHVIENLQVISARANLLKGSRSPSAMPKEVARYV